MSYPSRFVEFFGPSTWKTLHSIAWNYAEDANAPTEQEKKDIIDFLRLLEPLLPCPSCRKHYGAYMLKKPIDASSRAALTRWVYDLHDDVNRRSGKTSPTFEQHTRDYAGWDATMIEEYSGMSKKTQSLKLADPHFGRSGAELQEGVPIGTFGVVVLSIAIFLLGGAMVRLRAEGRAAALEDKNKQ